MRIHYLCGVAALLCTTYSQSALSGTIYASAYVGTDQSFQQNRTVNDATKSDSVSTGLSSAPDYRGASASAFAAMGVTKAASYAVSGGIHGASAYASAGWSDTIFYSNEALNGTRGQVTLNFFYRYSLDTITGPLDAWNQGKTARASFYNSVNANAGVGYASSTVEQVVTHLGPHVGGYRRHETEDLHGKRSGGVPNQQSITFEFIWGQAIHISNSLNALCDVGYTLAEPFASCLVDSYHSTYWAGFTDLKAGNTLVTDYVLTSASGTDYNRSFVPEADIPEPLSFALLAVGAAAMVPSYRRRRTRSQ